MCSGSRSFRGGAVCKVVPDCKRLTNSKKYGIMFLSEDDKSEFVEDNMKVDVIKKYFQSWLDNDVEIVKQTFSENALYSECYRPEYHGLSQIVTWFENWNNKGQVLEWTIKRIFEQNQTLIVEWYFRCNYDGKIDGFDGVTIADFDKDMKILKLCEFQSKAEHYYPYES